MATAAKEHRKAQRRSQSFAREQMKKGHQWEVADLRAAGLNPILSAHGSVPMPSGGPAPAAGIEQTVSSAMDVARTGKQTRMMGAEKHALDMSAYNSWKQGLKARNEADLKEQETTLLLDTMPHLVNSAKANADRMRAEADMAGYRKPYEKALGEFYANPAGKGAKWWSEALKNLVGPLNFSAIGRPR